MISRFNQHWTKSFRYPYVKHRAAFTEIKESFKQKFITEITGLRRMGKTTILLQCINELIIQGIDPLSVWYFSFDLEVKSLDKLFLDFAKITRKDIQKDQIYVFLDEVQKLDQFQNQVKIYYDLYPNMKFFISGSTSLFIRKKTQESLAGRINTFFLKPLSFSEYLLFADEESKELNLFTEKKEKIFTEYLENQFIDAIQIKDKIQKQDYLVSIIKKIIFEDIPSIFPIDYPEILFSIVKRVAFHPGLLINLQVLSRELQISNKTLSQYLQYLEDSYLIKKLYNFSKNLIRSERKLKKYYLSSSSFTKALCPDVEIGRLFENFVISQNNFEFFWLDAYRHEVDFVDTEGENPVPIEIKYKESVDFRECKNLSLFAKKFGAHETKLIYKGPEAFSKNHFGIKVDYVPAF